MTMTDTPVAKPTTATSPSRTAVRTGWTLTGLVSAFLLFDSVGKLVKVPEVVAGTLKMGFPESSIRLMGVLLLAGVVLYLVPRTSVFGAVFTTAYLGGAVCAQVRVEAPLLGFTLFPVYVAVLLWLGLYLRSAALRRLVRTGY
jgi:hypothetical protein